MKTSMLLKLGILGTIVATLCCFTPILVVALGVLGLSAWTGHLDAALLPTLGIFIVVTFYALARKARETG